MRDVVAWRLVVSNALNETGLRHLKLHSEFVRNVVGEVSDAGVCDPRREVDMDQVLLFALILTIVFALGKLGERWGPYIFGVMVIALVLESLYYALR